MRGLSVFLLLLFSLCSGAQSSQYENWHVGGGLSFGTLNFSQNGAGAIAVPIDYDFLKFKNSSFSLGTNLKIGSEDEYGVSFPVLLILILLADGTGANFNDINSSSNGSTPYGVGLFSDLPLLLHYNFGQGTTNDRDRRFGFYVGGGMTYTLTGFTLQKTTQQSTHFFGFAGNIGIRWKDSKDSHEDLGFSMVLPQNNPIGPIHKPVFYQLNLTIFR